MSTLNEKGIEPPPPIEFLTENKDRDRWDRWFRVMTKHFPRVRVYTKALNVASVAAASVQEQTFSVPGLTTEDHVIVNRAASPANVGIGNARVSAADTLAISFVNPTAGAVVPGNQTYHVIAIRR